MFTGKACCFKGKQFFKIGSSSSHNEPDMFLCAACNGKGWARQGGEEKGMKQYQHYTKPASPQEALQWKVILKCIIMGNLLNPNY